MQATITHAADLIESIRSRWAPGQLVGGLSSKQVAYLERLAVADGFPAISRGTWRTSAPWTGGDYIDPTGTVVHWKVLVNNAGNGRLELIPRTVEPASSTNDDWF